MILTNLQSVRTSKFLTQGDLARLSGISRTAILRLEQGGEARFSTVRKLAKALGVTPDALYAAARPRPLPMMGQDEAISGVVRAVIDAQEDGARRVILPLSSVIDIRTYGDALFDAIRTTPGVTAVQFSLDLGPPAGSMAGFVIDCSPVRASDA